MIRNVEDFDRLIMAMGQFEWLADERFATAEKRLEHAPEFPAMMRSVIAGRTAREWLDAFHAENLPVALVAEFQDLPEDPQVIANNMAVVPTEDMGLERVIRDPINVDGVGRVGPKKAPELGEHTDEILGELGYAASDIDRLRTDGVV